MQKKYGARVLYIDTDAHHGDGVQWSFYDDPNVCTLSIHETGRYLFPGTGNITERGNGKGYGTSFNFPIDAFTEDESFLEIYRTACQEVTEYFQTGCHFNAKWCGCSLLRSTYPFIWNNEYLRRNSTSRT